MNKKNSLIFSVTYENYMNNILNDKENKSLGQWKIDPEMIDQLKYAYAYLTNSNQMIVKRYEIDHFEYESVEKGYDQKDKYCLIFNKSEDVFFEYPNSPVQGRHYENDEELYALPRIDKGEADSRLEASRTSTSNNASTKKAGVKNDAQTRLNNIWKEEFSDRKLPPVEDAKKMIASAEEDPEQDLSALLTEYYVKLDKA
jgi:hypothetical protein